MAFQLPDPYGGGPRTWRPPPRGPMIWGGGQLPPWARPGAIGGYGIRGSNPPGVGGDFSNFDADPGVAAAKASEAAGLSELDAWLKGQREQALIAFGDPEMAASAGVELNPALRELIEKNFASGNAVLARLRHGRDQQRKAILNRLAGRGIIRSGETGYQEAESARSYGNAEYDARNKLLAGLSGYLQEYLDRKNALRNAVLQAYQNAYYNAVSNPAAYFGIFGGGGSSGGSGYPGLAGSWGWQPGQ